jgi:hypothetical protein
MSITKEATWYLTVKYSTDSSLIIEGFGPHSLVGVVQDVLEGNYPADDSAPVESITISKERP